MLPDPAVVRRVVADLLPGIAPGSVVVDMSSSEPLVTRELAAEAAGHGVTLVDAPVSGGVAGAVSGRLTIMAGGAPGDVRRVRGLLDVLDPRVVPVGDVGAGHAVKALNNLLSTTHLLATCEAMAAAEFGLDVPTVLGAINSCSGRSGFTENKWPNFIVPGTFDSGFSLRLMLKDSGSPSAWPSSQARPRRCRPPRWTCGPRPPSPCPQTPTTPRSPAGSARYPGACARVIPAIPSTRSAGPAGSIPPRSPPRR